MSSAEKKDKPVAEKTSAKSTDEKKPPADAKKPPADSKKAHADANKPPDKKGDKKDEKKGGKKDEKKGDKKDKKVENKGAKKGEDIKFCKHFCNLIPTNVPGPSTVQSKLHPRKDVFVLKVSRVNPNGARKSKLELELVTPKYNDKRPIYRVDTRETQCDCEPPVRCCYCYNRCP